MVEYITYKRNYGVHKKGDIRCCGKCGCKLTTANAVQTVGYWHSHCRSCKREVNTSWRNRNIDYVREARKNSWNNMSPEQQARHSECGRKWRHDNHERNKELQRRWRLSNPEKVKKSWNRYEEKIREEKSTQNTVAAFMALNKIAEDDNA